MEELHSSRRRKKPHGAEAVARSAFGDIFGGPPKNWDVACPARIEDYSEIFGGAASASIPVLELPPADDDCRGGIDYSDIFGRFGGGDFGFSYDELFGEEKTFGFSCSNVRIPGDVFSNQKVNEASELPLDCFLGNHVENSEMDQFSSIPKQPDGILLKQFNKPSQRTSQAIMSASTTVVDASDPVHEIKRKVINEVLTNDTSTKGCKHNGEIEKEKSYNSSSNAKNCVLNQNADLRPPESNGASLVSENEKHHSRSSSYHSTSSGDISMSDVTFLKVSEISLQTKPLKGPPPSRPPPNLSKMTVDPKMRDSFSNTNQEGMSLKPMVNYQLHSSSGATKSSAIGDSNKDEHYFFDAEIDPSSAAATSVAAIKEAMEQARARLKRAKEYMERKHDKCHGKAGHNKTMNDDVGNDDGTEVIAAQNFLKENNMVEHIFPRRERQSSSLSGMEEARENEKSSKEVSITGQDKEDDTKVGEESQESEKKLKSSTVFCNVQKPENDISLKVACVAGMEGREDVADPIREGFILKDKGSKAEEKYDSITLDEDQKMRDSGETCTSEDEANKLNSFWCSSVCRENEKRLKTPNADCEFKLVNAYCEESELKATAGSCGYVDENKTDFIVSDVNCELNASTKELEDANETLFQDSFANEIRNSDGLSSNTLDEKESDANTTPCNNFDEETRSTIPQCSYDDDGQEIKSSNNSAKNNKGDVLHIKEVEWISAGNELKQELTQNTNELENVLEKFKLQGTVDHANIKQILKSRSEDSLEDFDAKEAGDAYAKFEDNVSSMATPLIQELKHSDVLTAEGACTGGCESIAQVSVTSELERNQNRSKAIDESCLQGQIDDLDSLKVDLAKQYGNLPANTRDSGQVSHAYVSENHKHPVMKESKKLIDIEMGKDKEDMIKLEEKEKYIEREKDHVAVERANHEAHERAIAEARLRAERIAVERVTAAARQRALEVAQEKVKKAAEFEKASREARLKAERLAVERATEEARKRAIEKALAEKAAKEARGQAAQINLTYKDRIKKGNTSVPVMEDSITRKKPSNDIPWNAQEQSAAANVQRFSDTYSNGGNESTVRCKAIYERQQRTAERAAKALAEKNMRDILAQREQAERRRLAESLDAEVKRWSSGKDGNLRALLSTLQYILGPDSGWQPISLTDVITNAAVKKAYRKATLCVHPDKLQQRGAGIQQKYICEKVFDLLKDAWNRFNSEER